MMRNTSYNLKITVRFFATYRQLIGIDRCEVQVHDPVTVAEVVEQLEEQYPQFSGKLRANALVAVNEHYVHREQILQPDDTIAFFPPVSGG